MKSGNQKRREFLLNEKNYHLKKLNGLEAEIKRLMKGVEEAKFKIMKIDEELDALEVREEVY